MKAHLSPFRVSAGVARFYLLHSSARGRTLRTRERTHTSSRLGQTKIQRATRERMRILGGPSIHGVCVCVCVRDNVSQPSFNPTQGNLETKPPLLSARVGDLTA